MFKLKDEELRLKEILVIIQKHSLIKKDGFTPQNVRGVLEDLGPTFVKLGQILSMRKDIIPKEYCTEFEKLTANVAPMSFETVQEIIEDELGKNIDTIFKSINKEPLGSASIAQVHSGYLTTGEHVVIKVQRPNIREIMQQDISLLKKASAFLKLSSLNQTLDFNMLIDELWKISQEELDFKIEAKNAEDFAILNENINYISSPKIKKNLSTSKILVMDYIDGENIFDLSDNENKEDIAKKIIINYTKQIVDDGFFHADPHPGNIKILDGKISWIDMGMMGKLESKDRSLIKSALQAIVRRDTEKLKNIVLIMGEYSVPINHSQLYADIDSLMEKYCSMDIGDINIGKILDELLSVAKYHKIAVPNGLSMLTRGVIILDGVINTLCPTINVVEIVSDKLKDDFLTFDSIKKEMSDDVMALYKMNKKLLEIPALTADALKYTLKGQTKINLNLIDSKETLEVINKITDKIILCILAASLLLGSSLLCLTNMTPKILGVPILGVLGFITTFIICIWLIFKKVK